MIIKKINGVSFKLVHEELISYDGGLTHFSDSYWLECDKEGNVIDADGNGAVQRKHFLCKVPSNSLDFDLSSISDECFTKFSS